MGISENLLENVCRIKILISTDTASAFFIFTVFACFFPSPEMMIVVTQSSLHGYKAGIRFLSGMCSGLVIQVVVFAIGLSMIFKQSPTVFVLLKIVGVTYLLYVGWQAWFRSVAFTPQIKGMQGCQSLYIKAVIMNLTNPANPIYLLAIFPLYIDLSYSVKIQIFALGLVMIAGVITVFCGLSVLSGYIGHKWIQAERYQLFMQRLSGMTIVVFAIILAFYQP